MSKVQDVISIEQALSLSSAEGFVLSKVYAQVLDVLEAHECWNHWFASVARHCKSRPEESLDDYIRMIRVNIFYLEDVEAGAAASKDLVSSKKMSYVDFRRLVLDKVLESEEYKTESVLLMGVLDMFTNRDDQIAAMERLCFIFEKKAHSEPLLHKFYERLRKTQPENAKALRYFRNLYSQSQDWIAVIDVLKKLLDSAKHKQEVFRYGQELAAVNLYQLGDCKAAIYCIEKYCSGSTLDTSTIHYEAYYRLENFEGCLQVLRSALSSVAEPATQAILHFRMAALYERLNKIKMANEHFKNALDLDNSFFEAIEGLISTSIKLTNWADVSQWLIVLCSRTRSQTLLGQLNAGIFRLQEGLASVKSNR
jgi:tetratricopeptide (TPR) repeat protein